MPRRRIGHRHRETPEQGQYSDNCYRGPSHLEVPRKSAARTQRLGARLVLLAPLHSPAGFVCSMHFLGQKRPYDATGSIRPDFHDSHRSVR